VVRPGAARALPIDSAPVVRPRVVGATVHFGPTLRRTLARPRGIAGPPAVDRYNRGSNPMPGEAAVTDGGEVTRLLRSLRGGDKGAFDRLIPLVYDDLKRMARNQLRRSGRGRTLSTTGLVHEAYAKLARHPGLDVQDKSHFFAVSARAMRQVLVDLARARASQKRQAGIRVTLGEHASPPVQAPHLLEVDQAVEDLRARHERLAQVVECRYFAGLTEEETAAALGVSLRTAQRDWLRARAWLLEALRPSAGR